MNKQIEQTLQALDVEVSEENGIILKKFINEILSGVVHQPLYTGRKETSVRFDINIMATALYDSFILGVGKSTYEDFLADLIGRTRSRKIVECRALIIKKLKDKYGMSLSELGKIFGCRDHTSILHSLRNFETYCKFNKELGYLNQTITL